MCAEAFETLWNPCHLLPTATRLGQLSATTVLT